MPEKYRTHPPAGFGCQGRARTSAEQGRFPPYCGQGPFGLAGATNPANPLQATSMRRHAAYLCERRQSTQQQAKLVVRPQSHTVCSKLSEYIGELFLWSFAKHDGKLFLHLVDPEPQAAAWEKRRWELGE